MRRDPTDRLLLDPPAGRRGWPEVAALALIALAAVVACSKVWNYDIFWHLAGGRWMLRHGRVLGHDPFSTPAAPGAAPAEWVNVHWLFQLMAASLHAAGGWAALVAMKMVAFTAAVGVLAWWLRRRVGPAWLMLVGLGVVAAVENRVRARPEILTFALLAVTLVLLESVRRGGSPRRLWWLVPVNVLWVNVHGLFVVGLAATWAAVAGAYVDRALRRPGRSPLATPQAVLPAIVATLACFASPWPVKAGLHPLLLWARLAGHGQLYSLGVEELRPTWQVDPLGNFSVLLGAVLALGTAAAMAARRRSVPFGHVLWLAGFAALALLAVRNVALFVIPAGLLLALHGGALLAPAARKLRAVPAAAMLVALAGAAGGYATEAVYRWQRRPEGRFGFGLVEGLHPIEMARWLAAEPAEGHVLPVEFGNGGAMLYYAPDRPVWMDGRLEVHPAERFRRHREMFKQLRSPRRACRAERAPLPPPVRFVVASAVQCDHIEAMARCGRRFTPVYVDRAGVCFARTALKGEKVTWPARPAPAPVDLAEWDRPLGLDGGPLLDVPTRRRWYRQNVPAAHWRAGAMLYSLGAHPLAIRYLTVAQRLGLAPPGAVLRILAQSHQRISEHWPLPVGRNLPADVNLSRALALYDRLAGLDLPAEEALAAALARARGMLRGEQVDAAGKAVQQAEAIALHTARADEDVATMRSVVETRRRLAEARRRELPMADLLPAERALLLTRRGVGLIDAAITELRAATSLPRQARLLLGDLLLRKGLPAEARRAFDAAGGADWQVRMRRGLCAWVEGDFRTAAGLLQAAAGGEASHPEPAAYLALLMEQLGDYAAAAAALSRHRQAAPVPPDSQVGALLNEIARRLKARGQLVPLRPGGAE